MASPEQLIIGVLQRPTTTPRKAVDLAVHLAVEARCERALEVRLADDRGMMAAWLRAALVERLDGDVVAEPLWERVVTDCGCEVPDALLKRARVAARTGRHEEACGLLKTALTCRVDYEFFTRAEALVWKCKPYLVTRGTVRIALIGSSTTTLLRSVLQCLCLRDNLDSVFYEAPFGAHTQELLFDGAGVDAFAPDFTFVLLNWRDLTFSHVCAPAMVEAAVGRVMSLLQGALKKTKTRVICASFVPPAEDPYYGLSSGRSEGRIAAIRAVNASLRMQAPDRVSVLDCERIAESHAGSWEDSTQWSSAKVYPSTSVLPRLAEQVLSVVRADRGWNRKLLLLDLDNTLWGGVVGEDGLGGIRLGPPSAQGERYQNLQMYLKALAERGVLLAVVSKNNHDDAAEVFLRHPSSVLRLQDFVAFRANWTEKKHNIQSIATDLRLGLDSFILLDDSPSERRAVRRELPDVLVPELSGEPSDTIAWMERTLHLQTLRLTTEDRTRTALYAAANQAQVLRARSSSIEEFLSDLQMQIEYGDVTADTVTRVTQLINKTNQFNLTTVRYSEDDVREKLDPFRWLFRWYRVRDRYADHGLIAVLLARKGAEWEVTQWLMSCRVIGRRIEAFMLADLLSHAKRSGVHCIRGQFVPTSKNHLVEDLLPRLGFVPDGPAHTYVLHVESTPIPACSFVTDSHSAAAI